MTSQAGNSDIQNKRPFMLAALRRRSPNTRARVLSHSCLEIFDTIAHLLSGEVFQ